MSDVIVGLDIGTSVIRAVIGEIDENGALQIIGVGKAPSTGLRNGVIVNIQATMSTITTAIDGAEFMSGREVTSVITGIGGSQVEGVNSRGVVAVADHGRNTHEITQEDVDRVIEAASAVKWPLDRKILHIVPQTYIVDGQTGIKKPVNMLGVRLEAEVHIVTAAFTSMQNILRCIGRAGYEVDGVMLKTLAASQAITTEEERELGSVIIDLGGGSTDALVIVDGSPVCTTSIPLSGNHITNDISIMCSISFDIAERIKKTSGCCWEPLLEQGEMVTIPGVGGRPPEEVPRIEICRIIQPRVEETLTMLRDKIGGMVKDRQLSGNVILTGGGALLPGIIDVACNVFDTRAVRIGVPGNFGGLQDEYRRPEFSTAVGLIVSNLDKTHGPEAQRGEKNGGKKKNLFSTIGGWFKEFF